MTIIIPFWIKNIKGDDSKRLSNVTQINECETHIVSNLRHLRRDVKSEF